MNEGTPEIVKSDVDVPTEQPSVEQPSEQQPSVEQPQVEQTNIEQTSSEQNTMEQTTPEQASSEQNNSEEVQMEKPTNPALSDSKSHLFAIRTTGGQEKVVLNLLQNRVNTQKINIQSVLLVNDLKGYVVLEAIDANEAFNAIQGVRHIRGQLRGELEFKDIEGYLVKKSTVTELEVDKIVEIIGGPFKGMKATITRVDHEKEEATVILLDAPYQLPVTVDANYLKISAA